MSRALTSLSLLVLWLSSACEAPSSRVLERHQLSLVEDTSGSFVGVSRDPDSGETVLLHERAGLFAFDGTLRQLASLDELLAGADTLPASPFTDVAALGNGEYALTAINEGFLFDGESLTLHFCYLPGEVVEVPGPDPVPTGPGDKQLTLSLGYAPESARLFAQPRTFDEETGEVLAAHVATFDITTGVEQAWFDVGDPGFLAGGLVVQPDGSVILGNGASLHHYDTGGRELTETADLADEVQTITGLARGETGKTLLVLDGEASALLEVELATPASLSP